MPIRNPKSLIARGYDRIAERYTEWALRVRADERARLLDHLAQELPKGAEMLDLGCGSGIPMTRALAERFRVTGADISPRQIEFAQVNVPTARFVCADMTQLKFPPASFDAVAAFYSIIHVPRSEHAALFRHIATWLRRGGFCLATLGIGNCETDYDEDWMGAPMYWSSYDAAGARQVVEQAGFRSLVTSQEITEDENGRPQTFLLVVARA